jgi:hypothetical protein
MWRATGQSKLTNDGPVHLSSDPKLTLRSPESRFSGYVLHLISPGTGEHWRCAIEFTKSVYWFPVSKAGNIGGFIGNVTGGLVGGR